MLQTQENLMNLDMRRYRSQYLPTLSAFYNYSDQTEATEFSPSLSLIGVSAKWNLFTSGQRNAKVSQARIEYEKAQNTKIQQSQMLQIAAMQARDNYHTALKSYEIEKRNNELAVKILHKTTEKYKQGMVSSIELAQINNHYLQSQMSYSAAVQELLSAKLELDKTHNQL